jgi:hypothetical protein
MAPQREADLSFEDFRKQLETAGLGDVGNDHAMAGVRMAGADRFEEARSFLRQRYAGMRVHHSAKDAAGQTFDFAEIGSQPALLHTGGRIAAPPPSDRPVLADGQHVLMPRDGLPAPDPGLVPIRRITLEELSRYESLDHYFHKQPKSARRQGSILARADAPGQGAPAHEYAHAYQFVANFGGGGIFSVWKPDVKDPQVFSLSQLWIVAQATNGTQTAEAGWQVFPTLYNTDQPVFFCYYTADGYQSTGSYNGARGDFVQVSTTIAPGMALTALSQPGALAEVAIRYAFYQGNWWLYFGTPAGDSPVGYYPGSLYAGGPMATGAQEVDFGGETVGNGDYPAMGSGQLPAAGRNQAASTRNIFYALPDGSGQTADVALRVDDRWVPAYDVTFSTAADWRAFILFGGPGGQPV